MNGAYEIFTLHQPYPPHRSNYWEVKLNYLYGGVANVWLIYYRTWGGGGVFCVEGRERE